MHSSLDTRGEDEAEILVEDVVRVDRAVTKEEEESGSFDERVPSCICRCLQGIPAYQVGTLPLLKILRFLSIPPG